MHIALICPSLHGHLNTMLALGAELAGRGHRITLVGTPDTLPRAEAAGFQFLAVGQAEHDSGILRERQARLGRLAGLAAMRYTGTLLREGAAIVLRDALPELRATGVEAIVTDQVSPSGAALADVLGIPYVVVCSALALNFDTEVPAPAVPWRWRKGAVWRLRNRLGNSLLAAAAQLVYDVCNDFRECHHLPPWDRHFGNSAGLAQIAQQPVFFDYPRKDLPPHFHYTAPWRTTVRPHDPPFPFERLDGGRPLIYASLGTLQNRLLHLFKAIAEACAGTPEQLVISLGRADAAEMHDWPGSPIVVPFAPQLRLIERASLVITHAGLNTTFETLLQGLPMLAIPIANDQPGVARRLEWLGLGEVLLPRRATASRIRPAIRRLLHEPHYRRAAGSMQSKLAPLNGPAMAVDIIERAFETRERVLRVDVSEKESR